MPDFSKADIGATCRFCDRALHAFRYPLDDSKHFLLVCDENALEEGHILIIPKTHLLCIAEYSPEVHKEYLTLHEKVTNFVRAQYGSVAIFEHGKFGQTVFHSHVHFLPFAGKATDIVPEGADKLRPLADLNGLNDIYKDEGGYLFFSIDDEMWRVDPSLTAPRFFRDRFAVALGVPERGNWKAMREDLAIMQTVKDKNTETQKKWHAR